MRGKNPYFNFMASTPITHELPNFLKNLEIFFQKKLFLSNVLFFYIPTKVSRLYPRRIVTGPSKKKANLVFSSKDLKILKKELFIIKNNNFLCLLGTDGSGFYVAQARKVAKTEIYESYLPIFLKYCQSILKSIQTFRQEFSMVDIDDVTGLYNQRRLYKDLEVHAKNYKTTKTVFSVMFIDIDHFKSVNDGSGHLVGSQLLLDLASRLKRFLRESDTFYRYGGDEFVIILPGVSTANGTKIGRRILKKIKEKPFRIEDLKDSFYLSVSIGLATFPTHVKTITGVLELADNMLYKAKELGRGRVCSVTEIFGKSK